MTDPKVEQRHRDAAKRWAERPMSDYEAALLRDLQDSRLLREFARDATTYALGLAQGEHDGIRKGLEMATSKCRCRGTGRFMHPPNCSMCNDSTWDHECPDPIEVECLDRVCMAVRRALEELDHE